MTSLTRRGTFPYLYVEYTTRFSLIVANSDSIVTTADKQAACIRIIRRVLEGK